MKALKTTIILLVLTFASCGLNEKRQKETVSAGEGQMIIPIDKGFSEYVSGYTSGIIPVNAVIEIRFTPEFAATADRNKLTGVFVFEPGIKGKTEWVDDLTLVFRPGRLLGPGMIYSGSLYLHRIGAVKERLKVFPIRIQTLKKDFTVSVKNLEYAEEGDSYNLNGELLASDYIEPAEVEAYIKARLGRKSLNLAWNHSSADNIHSFVVEKISQTDEGQELVIEWDGTDYGIRQKSSATVIIPGKNDFSIQNINAVTGEAQKIEIVFSQPVDPDQELEGLIWLEPGTEMAMHVNSNIITLFPVATLQGRIELNIEASLKSTKGISLPASRSEVLEFTTLMPQIMLLGKGVILPASGNLILPFKTANLRAVDLRIIKIYENNLPYFLQNNDLDEEGYMKRFGRPVYSGRIDLMTRTSSNAGKWNMHTVDLSDYIDIEPGVLYKIQLGMRKSYSLYTCTESSGTGKFEEMLGQSEERLRASWDDPENYYDDYEYSLFYRYGYNWQERDNPCNEAYYSPDKTISRNILATNLGLMAKAGEDNKMHVFVNDIRTTEPVGEATVEIYNLQMQVIGSGSTAQDGSLSVTCTGKPFLVIVKKGTDRNYLKTNDGSSLSLSYFDVSGVKPEKGIKTFIYGERDVWRPGDSIYLSVIIRDMKKELPSGHPVQFELTNPLDQRVDNQVQSLPSNGLLVFRTKTPEDAVTGNYNAVIRVGGASFTRRVRVETVKPNRLKIELNFPMEPLGITGETEKGLLSVKWLNGAIARNLKASVDVLFRPVKTTFDNYKQFEFDDPVPSFSSETKNIFEGTLNDQGSATILFEPVSNGAPGMLSSIFTARVFEKGGDASIIQKSFRFVPYGEFVGINFPGLNDKSKMLFTDADNEIKIVTVDKNGNPVSSEAYITIYKVSYRWWWESDDEDLGQYISDENYTPAVTGKVITKSGEGSFRFRIPKNEWGRYVVKVSCPSGHTTGKIILVDWPWEYGSKGTSDGATLLSVNSDKEKYNVGDNIRLSFTAPENSKAIITLENATGIVDRMILNVSGPNSVVNFKARSEMSPNVYACVTLMQPHGQTVNDMPVRLYGIVPVMVEDATTRLNPRLTAPDEVRSQQPFEVKVSEAGRKAMSYTIAVVDEGLLDITGFRTHDPWSYFFAREALGVRTWDIYDYVLGALGGTLDRAMATGGDQALGDKAATKARRFIPVVKFMGPFTLETGKTNTHKVTLPLYTGSVRTMVIAGNEKAFGLTDKQVLIRDPLMILATAPRVLSPGEKVTLPVSVFVQKENINKVKLEATGNDMIRFTSKSREISFSEAGEKDTDFEFTTADRTGKAEITVTASGSGETAVYKLEIEIRSPNPPETRSEPEVLMPGEKYEKRFVPFGMEGTGSAVLEVSSLPSVNLKKRLGYLVEYPHGCSEQVTSAAFPQLWMKALSGNDPSVAEKSSANITAAIRILSSRQIAGGGIMLWPGSYQPDNWVTSYAGHFLIEAEKLGYSIPSGLKNRWLGFQKKLAQSYRFENNARYAANDQAYRLFTLALAGQPEKGAMNRLRESAGIPQLSRWLLAASFALTGRAEVAEELIDVRSLSTEPDYYDYYYGGYLRDRSIILYTLTMLKKEDQAIPLLKAVCDDLNRDVWYSTQTIAWGLFAYMKYAELMPSDENKPGKILVSFNGSGKEISVTSKVVFTENLPMKTDKNLLKAENISQNPVYVTFIQKGVPLKSDILREEKGLAMSTEYLDMEMNRVDERSLEQGYDFVMVVKVTNNTFRRVDNIALTQMVPSGWEIQNTRLFEASRGIRESSYDYRDFRDDRVFTYFGLDRGETKTFVIILNASYRGEYFQPAVWCEAMYTENFYSRIPGKPVSVTTQKLE